MIEIAQFWGKGATRGKACLCEPNSQLLPAVLTQSFFDIWNRPGANWLSFIEFEFKYAYWNMPSRFGGTSFLRRILRLSSFNPSGVHDDREVQCGSVIKFGTGHKLTAPTTRWFESLSLLFIPFGGWWYWRISPLNVRRSGFCVLQRHFILCNCPFGQIPFTSQRTLEIWMSPPWELSMNASRRLWRSHYGP
jgi:hypothetical protein